jgi:hypothetical protein
MNLPRKQLIEMALPLEAINGAPAPENSTRHGNPSAMNLWRARRDSALAEPSGVGQGLAMDDQGMGEHGQFSVADKAGNDV